MLAEDHNKVLGIMHLVYGGMHALSLIVIVFTFLILGITLPFAASRSDAPPLVFLGILGIVIVAFTLLLTVPPFVAGYAFLRRKRWAKVAGAISATLALLSIPMGTALGVYTFWFLFGENGRELYSPHDFSWQVGHMRDALHGARRPAKWISPKNSEKKIEYIPPTEPPDWR